MEEDGKKREDSSNGNYRKQPILSQSSHLMFHQSTKSCILPAAVILPKIGVDYVFLFFSKPSQSAKWRRAPLSVSHSCV